MKPGAYRLPPPLEADEQAALFEWAERMQGKYPELRWMFHVPNGGSRNKIEAARLKAQGVKAGVSDICLPVARGGWNALYIELKRDDGQSRPTTEQLVWIDGMIAQGNAALWCRGWVRAATVIMAYLDGKLTIGGTA